MVTVPDLRKQIAEEMEQLHHGEGCLVLKAINLGRLFVALRSSVRRNCWLKELKKLNYEERIVRRYLAIGDSWWIAPQPSGLELLTRLPYDLHKLEWLCRLSQEQLEKLSSCRNLQEDSRAEVISWVKKHLGIEGETSDTSEPSVADIRKRFDITVIRILDAIDDLPEETTDEQRLEILEALTKGFKEIEEALMADANQEDLALAGTPSPVQRECAAATAG